MTRVATPGAHSIEDVSALLKVSAAQCAKTLLVQGTEEGSVVALVVRGDHELNKIKAEKHPAVASPLTFATDAQVKDATGAAPGSIGPVGLDIPIIVDRAAAQLADFICGANADGHHLTGVNWAATCPRPKSPICAMCRPVIPARTVRARWPSRAASRLGIFSNLAPNTARH